MQAPLVALDVAVDATYEHRRAQVANGSAHDAKTEAEHGSVAEVERGLEETRHLGLDKEVVDAVHKHVPAQATGCEHSCLCYKYKLRISST